MSCRKVDGFSRDSTHGKRKKERRKAGRRNREGGRDGRGYTTMRF